MRYRVIRVTTNDMIEDSDRRVSTSTVWDGTDIEDLSRRHPPSNVFGADDLGHGSIEDAWIQWDHRFERYENEQWIACPDPRIRLDLGPSELELAIDEENHRLFPGDYDGGEEDLFSSVLDDEDLYPYSDSEPESGGPS